MENDNTGKHHPQQKNDTFLQTPWFISTLVFIVLGSTIFLFGERMVTFLDRSGLSDTELKSEIDALNKTGEAYFRDGQEIGKLQSDEQRFPVTLDEVSEEMVHAVLAAEDNDFFEHRGISVRGISRAVWEDFTSGGQGSGGSTITQQVLKNQVVGSERTYERKYREMILAMRAEDLLEKEEILETYLNMIYMGLNANGTNIYGIQAAALGIFGVDADELNVAQSAYLAGMIQAPGRYTPFHTDGSLNEERLENGKQRAQWVLERMVETERISEQEFEEARAYDYEANLAERIPRMIEEYPYLTHSIHDRAAKIMADLIMEEEGTERDDYEEGELEERASENLRTGGYQIHTTIDQDLYEAFHDVVRDHDFGPRSSDTFTFIDPETGEEEERGYLEQSAATLIDNDSGAILAMLEGRDFEESQIDFTQRPFQPGSAIKPILDYGPALQEGLLQPASTIDDAPLFDYGDTPPRNSQGNFKGLMSVREALTVSQNIPAIKAFRETREAIGEETFFEYGQRLGLRHLEDDDIVNDATAIGGMSRGWSVEDGTAAYASLGNQGQYQEPYMIERIETLDGEVVYEHDEEPEQVFDQQTAFLLTDMLRDVIDEPGGTAYRTIGNHFRSLELDLAGKTGTTNDQNDYWFIGYTPDVSLGLWTGYQERHRLADGYSTRHQQLWISLLEAVQETDEDHMQSDASFERPEGIEEVEVCATSGMLPTDLCEEEAELVTDYFHTDHVPTEEDDSVVRERIVIVDDEEYLALTETPDDFVQERDNVVVKREPLNIPEEYEDERSRWLPDDWDDSAVTEVDPREDNGKTPNVPTNVQTDGSSLTWDSVHEEDIAGYRIYTTEGEYVGSVPAHEENRYSVSSAEDHYVTAVDIMGRESDPSDENAQPPSPVDEDRLQSWEGDGDESQPEFEPDGPPTPPTGVEAEGSMSGVTISWEANDEEEAVHRYDVYVYTSSGFVQHGHTTGETTYTYTPQGSVNNQFYVVAINDEGESEPSTTVSVDLE